MKCLLWIADTTIISIIIMAIYITISISITMVVTSWLQRFLVPTRTSQGSSHGCCKWGKLILEIPANEQTVVFWTGLWEVFLKYIYGNSMDNSVRYKAINKNGRQSINLKFCWFLNLTTEPWSFLQVVCHCLRWFKRWLLWLLSRSGRDQPSRWSEP